VRLEQVGRHTQQRALGGVRVDDGAARDVGGAAGQLGEAAAEQAAGARLGRGHRGAAAAQQIGDDLVDAAAVAREDRSRARERRGQGVGLGARGGVAALVPGGDRDLSARGRDREAQTVGRAAA